MDPVLCEEDPWGIHGPGRYAVVVVAIPDSVMDAIEL